LYDKYQCAVSQRLADNKAYQKAMADCVSEAILPVQSSSAIIFPNPGNGVFRFKKDGQVIVAEKILLLQASGRQVAHFTNCSAFDISGHPAGVYFYHASINGILYRGKLVKQ
jgi:hypothetical protein